jgi:hypothetical protein
MHPIRDPGGFASEKQDVGWAEGVIEIGLRRPRCEQDETQPLGLPPSFESAP